MRARQHVGVDAQGKGRVAVAEVLGQFLDGDASGEHDTGVVVAELVEAFLAGGDVAAASAPVSGGLGDQRRLDKGWFSDRLRVVTGLDVLAVCVPAEQDAACVWLSVQSLPGERARPRRAPSDMLLDGSNGPVRERDDPLTVIFGQREYVSAAKLLDLPPNSDNLLVKVKVL